MGTQRREGLGPQNLVQGGKSRSATVQRGGLSRRGSAEGIQEGHRGRYVPFRGFGDGVPERGGGKGG